MITAILYIIAIAWGGYALYLMLEWEKGFMEKHGRPTIWQGTWAAVLILVFVPLMLLYKITTEVKRKAMLWKRRG